MTAMLRLAGGLMISVVSSYCGFFMADRLKKRRDFLRGMENALSFIQTEIEFGKYELRYIFKRIEDSPSLCGFFNYCTDAMKDNGIKAAWRAAVERTAYDANLKEEDKAALDDLSNELGMSDVWGQKKAIERTASLINGYGKHAEEEYLRLSKTYKGCGVLLGVFFLIILI